MRRLERKGKGERRRRDKGGKVREEKGKKKKDFGFLLIH